MSDLRRYDRVNVDLLCTFYALKRFELQSTIKNISEVGVLLEVDFNQDLLNSLAIGDIVEFQGMDYLNGLTKHERYIFQENARVKRIEPCGDKIKIACEVSGNDKMYKDYMSNLKVSSFISKLLNK